MIGEMRAMPNITTIAALVPMRHQSDRVPGKNYRSLAGKPLYEHIVNVLLACPEISTIVVDTDSAPIMRGLRGDFPKVQIIERPEHLRAGEVPMNEILLHDIQQVEADFYLQTHSTNPLLRPQTVSCTLVQLSAMLAIWKASRLALATTRRMISLGRVALPLWDLNCSRIPALLK